MQLGFAGYCPVVALADVYQEAFDLYAAGKHREAFDMFWQGIWRLPSISHANQYLMVARGIFKENTASRPHAWAWETSAKKQPPLTEAGQEKWSATLWKPI